MELLGDENSDAVGVQIVGISVLQLSELVESTLQYSFDWVVMPFLVIYFLSIFNFLRS